LQLFTVHRRREAKTIAILFQTNFQQVNRF